MEFLEEIQWVDEVDVVEVLALTLSKKGYVAISGNTVANLDHASLTFLATSALTLFTSSLIFVILMLPSSLGLNLPLATNSSLNFLFQALWIRSSLFKRVHYPEFGNRLRRLIILIFHLFLPVLTLSSSSEGVDDGISIVTIYSALVTIGSYVVSSSETLFLFFCCTSTLVEIPTNSSLVSPAVVVAASIFTSEVTKIHAIASWIATSKMLIHPPPPPPGRIGNRERNSNNRIDE
ncbi:hypothetical protein L1987_02203 [Smallanthus sonchifolius]|uniref:Uncharacterized protein n=1 Tax=Smallanthus sonchifolius TaxID=185202 RepID=A0ACB9K717_9ASTR|nr:hypothetical protein L1987_02203 [Smallanthus sonchifolius]